MTTTDTDKARQQLTAWAEAHGLSLAAERITRETFALVVPPEKGEKPQRDRTYWTLTLTNRDGASFSVPYTQGSSAWWNVRGNFVHRREGEGFSATCRACFTQWPCDEAIRMSWLPTSGVQPAAPDVADLLDCLASDAGSYENARDFADWCADYGYDEDSRTAEHTYNLVAEQARQLRHILGAEAYRELTEEMERL